MKACHAIKKIFFHPFYLFPSFLNYNHKILRRKMATATNLGFPYVGAQRELKKATESFWAGKTSASDLALAAQDIRKKNWTVQKEQGLDVIPVGEFSLYDRMLDTAYGFGVVPKRYADLSGVEQYLAMGRGLQKPAENIDVPAMEMSKWFDTNYHFIRPEFEQNQEFTLQSPSVLEHFLEAKTLGLNARPVLIGPVTFLHLGKSAKGSIHFDTLILLEKLLPVYIDLLGKLSEAGAEWVQMDEPILVLDLPEGVRTAFEKAYAMFSKIARKPKILVTTYFGRLENNIDLIKDNIDGLHIDLARAPEQLDSILKTIKPTQYLSIGLVDGRNLWKNDLNSSLALAEKVVNVLGKDHIFIAPSCSMLHSPYSISYEKKIANLSPESYDWLSFAVEKCHEIAIITKAINHGRASVQTELDANSKSIESRRTSVHTTNKIVHERLASVTTDQFERRSPFPKRREAQVAKLQLPLFPTTTIGSFPQTKQIRVARSKHSKGELTNEDYEEFIKKEIEHVVRFQEDVGLDVLVHGESERTDMVEYFGMLLHGFGFTENGWVVSYGSRCVKPPFIYGDIYRKEPMTIKESVYAQSLTSKPMKGMLTGPVTILKWSFPRDDIHPSVSCKQIALAIRDEVSDLETAGIPCIQVDEPAIREGLPLRKSDWDQYLQWSVDSFRLATSVVKDVTQIHTHMCYSDFNEIFDAIQRMDADVLTIENSKSDMKLLSAFETKQYSNEIGPGLYDIHSPRVPSVEEMSNRFAEMLKFIPKHLLWANPDCGLKTRQWSETEAALRNLVQVARNFRVQE